MTLPMALQAFLDDRSIEDNTRAWYWRMAQPLIAFLADDGDLNSVTVERLTPDAAGAWRESLLARDELSPATVNSHLRAVRAWCNWMADGLHSVQTADAPSALVAAWISWLEEGGHVSLAVARNLKAVRLQRQRVKAVSERDKQLMFEAARPSPRDYLIVRMLAATGCRLSGLVQMRVSGFEFRRLTDRRWLQWARIRLMVNDRNRWEWRGRTQIIEKGTKARVVYFGHRTAEAFFRYMESRAGDERDELFLGQRGPLTGWGVTLVLRRLAKRAGVDGPVNPHAWRHAFAKEMIKRGADLRTVADLMGHSNTHVTAATYLQFTDEELDERHEKYAWSD